MNDTCFIPKNIENIAPTSIRDGKYLIGKPDDELSYYMGGVSGNAGLFTTATDLFIFMSSLLQSKIVKEKVWKKFISETIRHLGWAAPTKASSAGDMLDTSAFGHTGFTGTMIWVEPESSLFTIFLTNRTHISRWDSIPTLQVIRRRLNNIIFSSL